MAITLVLRQTKGSALTWAELDANFTALRAGIDESRVRYYTTVAAMVAANNPLGTICYCDRYYGGGPIVDGLRYYSRGTSFGTPDNAVNWADAGGNYLELNYTVLDLDAASSESSFENALAAKNPDFATNIKKYGVPKNSAFYVGQIAIWHGTGGDWTFGNNNNLSIGQLSMENNTSGFSNTAVGYESISLNTSGTNNTAVGRSALRRNLTGSDSVAVGVDALAYATGGRNTAVGRSAGDQITSGTNNTAIGYKAMQGPAGASGANLFYNTALGDNALTWLFQGSNNVAIGFQAGLCEVNLGAGSNASNNVWVGTSSGRDTTTAQANTAVGHLSLLRNRTGVGHTAIGYNTVQAITGSTGNTAVGYEALRDSTVGLNTAVGYLSMSANSSFTNCAALGANTVVTGNNQVQLGDSATTTYVYGTVQNRSDERDKTDIQDTELGLDFINSLRPVDFRWDMRDDYRTEGQPLSEVTRDGSKKRVRLHHGFLAQDLPPAFGGLQDHSVAGGEDVMTVGYDEFIAPLVKAIQQLSARVAELEAQL